MEIDDYLGVIWRRLWILILVPAVAGGVVAAQVRSKPAQYASTATVAAPALVGGVSTNQYSGSAGARTFVANFEAAAKSSRIADKVAKETGVKASRIKKLTAVTPLGTSSLLEVRYQTNRAKTAKPVAQAVASETIRFLFDTQVELAQSSVDAAQAEVTKAEAALDTFTHDTGLVLVDKTYENIQKEIGQLESQQIQFQANAQLSAAAAAANLIEAKKTQLAMLAPIVRTYESLNDKKSRAITRLNDAQLRYESAAAQVRAGDPQRVVTTSDTKKVSPLPNLVQKAGAATGAGLFLAVGIVALLELWSARRRRPATPIPVAAAPATVSHVTGSRSAVSTSVAQFGTNSGRAAAEPATFVTAALRLAAAASGSRGRSRRWRGGRRR